MSEASFDRVISEHLALRERNRRLERQMPLDGYRDQAEGSTAEASPNTSPSVEPKTETRPEHWLDTESFWDTSGERPLPEFDWGDD